MADGFSAFSISNAEQEKVQRILRLLNDCQMHRSGFASQWEEIAALIRPADVNTFFYPNHNWPGQKKTERQVDATGMVALQRFSAICDSLLTPRNQRWHYLEATNPDLNKIRRVRLWFDEATRVPFKYRYAPVANFSAQNQSGWTSLGAFGTAGLFADKLDGSPGIRYKNFPLGGLFLFENHQGLVNGYIRWFRLKADQAMGVPEWRGRIPEPIWKAATQGSQTLFNFIQYVAERTDWDPDRVDYKGMKYESCYLSIVGRNILPEGGYRSFPLAASRYEQFGEEVYGRSPAMFVLPSLKTLNAQKKAFLKQGHRAADPVLLAYDDGLVNFDLTPGAMNHGGMNQDGRPLVGVLPTGNIQVTEEMMGEEKSTINDMFLVTLFQILTETPRMTATEVIERTQEKGILLAPTVGRQSDEKLGPLIDRELDLLVQQRLLPPMPPELREAEGEYAVQYTSPLAKAAKAQEAAGFMRTLQAVTEVVNVTQDQSPLDRFNFDVAVPAIADIQGVPESWMASDEEVAQKRQARSAQAQRQEQIAAAPAAAAMKKAEIAAAEAGVE